MSEPTKSTRLHHENMRREVWLRSVEAILRCGESTSHATSAAKRVLEQFDIEFPKSVNDTV